MLVAWLMAVQLSTTPPSDLGCTNEHLKTLRASVERIAHGDDFAGVSVTNETADSCALIRLARSASAGWTEARRVASKGGHPDLLAPTRSAVNELERLKDAHPSIALEVEYAQTAIGAAVAAAQDERAEMELLLTHARDLAERLIARGRAATWPRSFNVLAGELWFEVDRFEEARAAYGRALRVQESAVALIGMARAQARLGRRAEACVTYKRASDAAAALRAMAAVDLAHCR